MHFLNSNTSLQPCTFLRRDDSLFEDAVEVMDAVVELAIDVDGDGGGGGGKGGRCHHGWGGPGGGGGGGGWAIAAP